MFENQPRNKSNIVNFLQVQYNFQRKGKKYVKQMLY